MIGFSFTYFFELLIPAAGICLPISNKNKKNIIYAIAIIIAGMVVLTTVELVGTKLWMTSGGNISNFNLKIDNSNFLYPFIFYGSLWFLSVWAIIIIMIKIYTGIAWKDSIYLFALSYAIEHIFYCVRLLVEYFSKGMVSRENAAIYCCCLIGSFLLSYFWFAKPVVYKGKYHLNVLTSTRAVIAILALVWVLSLLASANEREGIHGIYAIACCIFILISLRGQMLRENERMEFAAKEQLWEKSLIRYQMSKESMAVVNQHYHDMKHQLQVLARMEDGSKRQAYLSEMESNIAAYDAVVRTGNEFMDTALTEKKLTCQSKHIAMSCIADGKQFTFMDELDIYTLLGNVLDNAIEANQKIDELDKRWISVQIQNKKGVKLIEVVNPYKGEINFKEGLPSTSKMDKDSHGFGVSSIKAITEKYNGQMVLKAENQKFLVRLIFN